MLGLRWLPVSEDWNEQLADAKRQGAAAWPRLCGLAATSIDFLQTDRLDRVATKLFATNLPTDLAAPPLRLALIGSCTLAQLAPALRVAAMRRTMWAEVHLGEYGQYFQDIENPVSSLWHFKPDTVLLALDALHLFGRPAASNADADAQVSEVLDRCDALWARLRDRGARIIHPTAMAVHSRLAGNNEHRVAWSQAAMVQRYNAALPARADAAKVDLLDLGAAAAIDGHASWHDRALWHRAKQDIATRAAPAWGDLAMRLVAARAGRSAKCLVLDLDNTLWGGVIGDDGLRGIVIGQGNAVGEAHLALQAYAKALSQRGVILAVCSKNDEANALEPFEKHPDMILRREDIACFVANWEDKPANLRRIASQLNIGLDALVFVDDNPFERAIVRRELPQVMVPELGNDPGDYVERIAQSGWFEAVSLTDEDLIRAAQYQANGRRDAASVQTTDMDGFLKGLSMELRHRPFDAIGVARIVQLINKSNQFNLTTARASESGIAALINDPTAIHLQMRLADSFGDNGMISVLIAHDIGGGTADIGTWLMSCRVLGRGVEAAALNLLAERARARGFTRLVGRYLPTSKNGMVADHYGRLGFAPIEQNIGGASLWQLDLVTFTPLASHIHSAEG